MSLTELNAISPIDGRYRSKTKIFSAFSEEALIKYRLEVEIEYLLLFVNYPYQNYLALTQVFLKNSETYTKIFQLTMQFK